MRAARLAFAVDAVASSQRLPALMRTTTWENSGDADAGAPQQQQQPTAAAAMAPAEVAAGDGTARAMSLDAGVAAEPGQTSVGQQAAAAEPMAVDSPVSPSPVPPPTMSQLASIVGWQVCAWVCGDGCITKGSTK
jgi:hypothetical protein